MTYVAIPSRTLPRSAQHVGSFGKSPAKPWHSNLESQSNGPRLGDRDLADAQNPVD